MFRKILLSATLIALLVLGLTQWNDSNPPANAPDEVFGGGSRLFELLGSVTQEGYPAVTETRIFRFPEDHGPHESYRNEWWYLTGNLDDERGQRFGYELTFFRFALEPRSAKIESGTDSQWRTNQVFIAHFAITDVNEGQFLVAQRYSRGALGLAGAQATPFRVWLEDWSVQANPDIENLAGDREHWQLAASDSRFALDLNLVAAKPPVLNGHDGLSKKSAVEGNASYYYSIPRMHSSGSLRIDDETYTVSGLSWLDREWSSSALASYQQGWDWFALQLSDGSDLMYYNIRQADGSPDPHSAGTWVSADGRSSPLSREDVVLTVTDRWQSPAGGIYPAGWTIEVKSLELVLAVNPLLANQELITTVRYWEGAVNVEGRRGQSTVSGRGYVELTGYSE